jgi:putative transcription factor
MQCETCGKPIKEGKRVKLEGSVVVTCSECAAYGVIVGDVRREEKKVVKPSPPKEQVKVELPVETETLVEDYNVRIRDARERRGMKQEDLAKALNEPVSLIHRLESGKFEPGDALIRKLQHHLGVKLIEKSGGLAALIKRGDSKELTLGDVVVVKKKK